MGLAFLALALLGCGNAADTSHLEKDLLHIEAKIPLPGIKGRIDHMAYDPAGRRVFMAALGNETVEVVDLVARKRLHSITGLREPQGVLYIQALGRLIVADGGSGDCLIYDGASFAALGRVALGDDADNVRYDGARVYVGYGSGGIAVIDPVAVQKTAELPLKGHPESFQVGDSDRIWVNVPDAGEIVMGNLKKLSVLSEWKNAGGSANFPMALDRQGDRLFVAYRHPAELRTVSCGTGMVMAKIPCVGDADDIFYDRASGLVIVSGGEGYLDVIRGTVLVNHIATRNGARTCLWLPNERKLILALPARNGEEAALWVYAM